MNKGKELLSLDKQILSDITVYMKYAKHLPKLERRETWEELVTRNRDMHIKKHPQLEEQIVDIYDKFVFTKKVLPSMRSLQFGGRAIELNNARIYNCAFLPVDSVYAFSETMFLLLGGTGVGYSVQNHHIEKLPEIRKPDYNKHRRYVVQDSIIGWADAIKTLFKSYTSAITSHIEFDLSDIRQKGALLVTAGGKAPGPEPLRIALVKIEAILREKKDRSKLTDLECHRIQCFIADAVLAGGIRRAAMISLFDLDSNAMLNCKAGNWWETMPELGRANNSVVLLRHKLDRSTFDKVWERIEASGSGEPGIYLTNDKDWGTNPCCEIALRPNQFCNLTEINMSDISSQDDLNSRAAAASFLGTLQASYSDFHYLRDVWRRNTEKDALLGVSMTGIASESNLKLDYEQASKLVIEQNKITAEAIGINPAARTTAVKPAGTTSLVVGSSSGIHAWHAEFYKRRLRIGKNEALYTYLSIRHPEMLEDEFFSPQTQSVITVPQKAPEGAITRQESTINLLERVKLISDNWVHNGHVKGQNTHNVSCTVSIRPGEWEEVGEWMWKNRDCYNGLSVLPFDGGTYKQTPFEDCTEEEYNQLMSTLKDVDLTQVVELVDNTNLTDQAACAGGACEVT
jgi:ribonucleoside-triphosphate reductase